MGIAMRTLKALGGVVLALAFAAPAYAQFGDEIVFDPTMYAAQLQQLTAEQATASTVAQQLQIDIANDTGGNAGAWINNSAYLASLPQLIDLQQGLAYDNQALAQQFAVMYPGLPQPGAG